MDVALGLSNKALLHGLVSLKFLSLRAGRCVLNPNAWEHFRSEYKLGNLIELVRSQLLGAKTKSYYMSPKQYGNAG